jgi:pimeloyl-ACP methyl ester carboxylesterase/CRP-like cAMP-binding protein
MPLTTINGHGHFYEDLGSGEPVVLLHGMENSARYFERLIPDLAADFRVIAPDLRGMGRSEHVTELPAKAWLDDLLALLDQLGIGTAHLYGVSLGGLLAMRLAIESPERVLTLTVDSPVIVMSVEPPARAEQPWQEPPPRAVAQLREMHGDDWRAVRTNCTRFQRDPELREYLNVGEAVAAITAPTLIVRGDIEEGGHPFAHAIELHQLIPNSWLWISPHSVSLLTRRHPVDSLRIFRDFVSQSMSAALTDDPVSQERMRLLSRVDLFAGVDRGELSRLAALASATTLRGGDVVFRQGDLPDRLYLVLSGAFGVSVAGEEGELPLRVLGAGDFFGDMALLSDEPRSATISCVEDGELLQLEQRHIRALLRRDPSVALAIAAALSRRLLSHERALLARDLTARTNGR